MKDRILKIFNFRILFVLAIFSIMSVTAAYNLLYGNKIWFSVYIVLSALSVAALFIIFRKFNKYIVTVLYAFLSLFLFTGIISLTVNNFSPLKFNNEISVQGKTGDYYEINDKEIILRLENITFGGNKAAGKLEVRIHPKAWAAAEIEPAAGIILQFTAIPENNKIINYYGGFNSKIYKNDLKYTVTLDENTEIYAEKGKPLLISGVRERIKTAVYNNMDAETASVAYSMFTGDTRDIDNKAVSDLRASGLAHILAVSGLHVSFVYLGLSLLLRKLKARKTVQFGITTLVLILYMFLCGFTASVIRASVMCTILQLSRIFYKRYDMLSSLSFGALLIIIAAPLMIFDAGFQLSYAAMAGIACFSSIINKALLKLVRFKSLSGAIAMTVSAQLGTIPLMFSYFNTFSIYAVLSNVIIIPILQFGFIAFISSLIPVLFFPAAGGILTIFSYPLKLVIKLSNLIAALPLAELIVFPMLSVMIIYYAAMLFAGRYFMSAKKPKTVLSLVSLVIMILLCAVPNFPSVQQPENAYIADIQYSNTVLVTDSANNKILVTDFNGAYNIRKFLIDSRIRRIDKLVLTGKQTAVDDIDAFVRHFRIKELYIASVAGTDGGLSDKKYTVESGGEIIFGGVRILQLFDDKTYYATIIDCNKRILIAESVSKKYTDYLNGIGIYDADVLIGGFTDALYYENYFWMRQYCYTNYTETQHSRYFTYKI